eukprot:403346594
MNVRKLKYLSDSPQGVDKTVELPQNYMISNHKLIDNPQQNPKTPINNQDDLDECDSDEFDEGCKSQCQEQKRIELLGKNSNKNNLIESAQIGNFENAKASMLHSPNSQRDLEFKKAQEFANKNRQLQNNDMLSNYTSPQKQALSPSETQNQIYVHSNNFTNELPHSLNTNNYTDQNNFHIQQQQSILNQTGSDNETSSKSPNTKKSRTQLAQHKRNYTHIGAQILLNNKNQAYSLCNGSQSFGQEYIPNQLQNVKSQKNLKARPNQQQQNSKQQVTSASKITNNLTNYNTKNTQFETQPYQQVQVQTLQSQPQFTTNINPVSNYQSKVMSSISHTRKQSEYYQPTLSPETLLFSNEINSNPPSQFVVTNTNTNINTRVQSRANPFSPKNVQNKSPVSNQNQDIYKFDNLTQRSLQNKNKTQNLKKQFLGTHKYSVKTNYTSGSNLGFTQNINTKTLTSEQLKHQTFGTAKMSNFTSNTQQYGVNKNGLTSQRYLASNKSQERQQISNANNQYEGQQKCKQEDTQEQNIQQKQAAIIQKYLKGEISKDKANMLQQKLNGSKILQSSKSLSNLTGKSTKVSSTKERDEIINTFTQRMSDYQHIKKQKQLQLDQITIEQEENDAQKICTFKPDISLTRTTTEIVNAKLLSGQANMSLDMHQEQELRLQQKHQQIIDTSPKSDFNQFYTRQQIFNRKYQENIERRMMNEAEKELASIERDDRSKSAKSKSRERRQDTHKYKMQSNVEAQNLSNNMERQSQQQSGPININNKSPNAIRNKNIPQDQNDLSTERSRSRTRRDLSEPKTKSYLERFKQQLKQDDSQMQKEGVQKIKQLQDPEEFFKRLSSPIVKTYRGASPLNNFEDFQSNLFCSTTRNHNKSINGKQRNMQSQERGSMKIEENSKIDKVMGDKQKKELSRIKLLDQIKIDLQDHVKAIVNSRVSENLQETQLNTNQIETILIQLHMLNVKDKTNSNKVKKLIKDLIEPINLTSLIQFFTLLLKPPSQMRDQEAEEYYSQFKQRNYYLIQNREDVRRSRQERSFDGRSMRSLSQNSIHSFSPNINTRNAELSSRSKQRALGALSPQNGGNKESIKLPLYEQMKLIESAKNAKLEAQRKNKEEQHKKECSFKPTLAKPKITKNQLNGSQTQRISGHQVNVFDKLMNIAKVKRQRQKQDLKQKQQEQKEIEENSNAAKMKKLYEQNLKKRREITELQNNQKRVSRSPSPDKNISASNNNRNTISNISSNLTGNYVIKEMNESISDITIEEDGQSSLRDVINSTNSRLNQSNVEVTIPLLHVDVKHSNGSITRLSVYEGDDIYQLADNFSMQYEITEDVKIKLIEYVESQLERLKEINANNCHKS